MNQEAASKHKVVLDDMLANHLKLVFCGTAASRRSAEKQAYYAHPGNNFWRALYAIGLTERLLKPHEYRQLLALGVGFTDLAKHASGTDKELPKHAFDAQALATRIQTYQPQIIAFTSKTAARHALGYNASYGLQTATFYPSRVFVLPSPSGQARAFWDIRIWQHLADMFHAMPAPDYLQNKTVTSF